jgi:hypothetical protein
MNKKLGVEFEHDDCTLNICESSIDDGSPCIDFYVNENETAGRFFISSKEELEEFILSLRNFAELIRLPQK